MGLALISDEAPPTTTHSALKNVRHVVGRNISVGFRVQWIGWKIYLEGRWSAFRQSPTGFPVSLQEEVRVKQKQVERRSLLVGIGANAVMGTAGMAIFMITGMEAVFLDGAFTLIALASGVVAVFISAHSIRTTDNYPNGFFALEPIYAICKALLTISLLVFSLLNVVQGLVDYFVHDVKVAPALGPVVWYELAMVVIGAGLWWYHNRQNQAIRGASTMLHAEAKTTLVDAIISGGIGVTALALSFVPEDSPIGFLNYTADFVITAILVVVSVKEPFGVLRTAFVELVGGVVRDDKMNQFVEVAARQCLPGGTRYDFCHIFKQGMSYTVDVYLRTDSPTIRVASLISQKRKLEKMLESRFTIVDVNFCFD